MLLGVACNFIMLAVSIAVFKIRKLETMQNQK